MNAGGLFPELAGPTLDSLKRIHRGGDGHVRFMRPSRVGGLEPIRSFRRDRLDAIEEIRHQLSTDTYYSINAYYRDGTGKDEDLRFLNAVYSDCDSYDLSLGEAVGLVIDAQEVGVLPPMSAIVRSGRGIWLLWLLVQEKDQSQPERAFRDKRLLYSEVERAVYKRINSVEPKLKPDPRALDTTRLTRLDGSFHTGAGRRVSYWWQTDAQGKGYFYTLQDLARWFGVKATRHRRQRQKSKRPSSEAASPNRKRGFIALNEKIRKDLLALEEARRGMPAGSRYFGALALATVLHKLSRSPGEIELEIERYAANCKPSMTCGEQRKAIAGAEKGLKWSGRRLAEILDVDLEEADRLNLAVIRPDLVPFREIHREPRKDRRAKRQATIVKIAGEHPGICGVDAGTSRGVRQVRRLLEEHGMKASPPTISRDIKSLAMDGRI